MRKIILMLLLLLANNTMALDESKGLASIIYKSKATPLIMQTAVNDAKYNALKRYITESSPAKSKSFDARQSEIMAAIDDFILSSTVISEDNNKERKTYSVTVRVEINKPKLNSFLNNQAVNTSTTGLNNNSINRSITLVFYSRSQSSAKSYDARVVKISQSNSKGNVISTESGNESENISGSSASVSASGSKGRNASNNTKNENGGSAELKSDKILWEVSSSNEVNTAMSQVFVEAGLEVIDAEYVETESRGLLNLSTIRKNFGSGNDLTPENTRNMANGIKNAGIYYVAIGTMDVALSGLDAQTGNPRVSVTINGKVIDLSGKFPKTIGSVGPVTFYGTAPDRTVAQKNALNQATEEVASQIVDQLNNKGF